MTIKQLYPTQHPALDLNFARQKRLDPRITFTRGSTATYVGSDGLIKTAASGEARFDHDPVTEESLGLLIEEDRRNLLTESEDVSGYTRADMTTPLDSSAVNPTGSLGSYKILANSGLSTNGIRIYKSASASNNIVVSAFVKKSTHRYVYVGFGGTSNHFTALFDIEPGITSDRLLGQGTAGSSTNVSAGYQDFPNDWIRIWAVGTTTGSSGPTVGLSEDASTFTINNWTAAGTEEIYVWGLQYENGVVFPTSYIPTSGSAVTRAAEVASLTNSNIYDTNSFTILNEPFGSAAGSSSLSLIGAGETPIKRTAVYNQDLTQAQINTSVDKTDEFWRWRILLKSTAENFRLADFTTDGQVTVDWGDGTVETLTTDAHTFNRRGYHEVGFRLDSGTYFRPNINSNTTHKDKVVAIGPAPESMKLSANRGFYGCSKLEAFDATVDTTGETIFSYAWRGCPILTSFPLIDTSSGTTFISTWTNCSSLTSFPLIDTSSGTRFDEAWRNCSSLTSFPSIDTSSGTDFYLAWKNCSSLTSFPSIDTSSGTTFREAWYNCSSLTSFPLLNTSSGTNFNSAWYDCSSLTSFPLIDTSSGTNFNAAWRNCSNLTSFPSIDTSSGANFQSAWDGCSSLTNFPLIDTSNGNNFKFTWRNCSSLTSFPANFFDSWANTPVNNCFVDAWEGCSSLTKTSVQRILNSIDTSGQSAPASGVDITIDYDAGTGTPSVATAVTNLKSRGWTITLNGVAQ